MRVKIWRKFRPIFRQDRCETWRAKRSLSCSAYNTRSKTKRAIKPDMDQRKRNSIHKSWKVQIRANACWNCCLTPIKSVTKLTTYFDTAYRHISNKPVVIKKVLNQCWTKVPETLYSKDTIKVIFERSVDTSPIYMLLYKEWRFMGPLV